MSSHFYFLYIITLHSILICYFHFQLRLNKVALWYSHTPNTSNRKAFRNHTTSLFKHIQISLSCPIVVLVLAIAHIFLSQGLYDHEPRLVYYHSYIFKLFSCSTILAIVHRMCSSGVIWFANFWQQFERIGGGPLESPPLPDKRALQSGKSWIKNISTSLPSQPLFYYCSVDSIALTPPKQKSMYKIAGNIKKDASLTELSGVSVHKVHGFKMLGKIVR